MQLSISKKKVIKLLYNKINTSNISNKSCGNIIRSLHFSMPIMFLIIISLGSYRTCIITFNLLSLTAIVFYLFGGCFLTMLELKLLKDNYTIIDPFIEYFNFKLTNDSRLIMTIYIMALYWYIFLFIIYIRFF
jgi:hypothetical protein